MPEESLKFISKANGMYKEIFLLDFNHWGGVWGGVCPLPGKNDRRYVCMSFINTYQTYMLNS